MRLDLPGCRVRSWQAGDAPALARYGDNRAIWRNLRDRFPQPFTLAAAEAWIRTAAAARPETHFAIEVGGEAAGGIGLELQDDVYHRSAELGYWLGEPFWGRGIMTEVVRAVTAWGFTGLDLIRIYARVFAWNDASRRVLEKAGYAYEGRLRQAAIKDGRVVDELIYAVTR